MITGKLNRALRRMPVFTILQLLPMRSLILPQASCMKVLAKPGTVESTPSSREEPPKLSRKIERKPQIPLVSPCRKENKYNLMASGL
jgi:hypothetical protein